ncbi:AAA-domain-containing protein [Martensiomyces pterosporus]|nr:AAA-domain-containing protein [Martensiomyces pterosporus]
MSQSLVVAFSPLHSCLVSLPARWASALSAQPASKGCMVFKLTWGSGKEQSAYVAWSGGISRSEQRDRSGSLSPHVIEIDGTFGSQLGLSEGTQVSVEFVPQVATCTAAEVVPAHFDDWEILELNAGAVEDRLLQQARVVAVDQPIVFWLNSSTSVCLNTTGIVPKALVCLLDNDTEVVVAPKVRSQANGAGSANMLGGEEEEETGRQRRIFCLRVAADAGVEAGAAYVNSKSALVETLGLSAGRGGQRIVRVGPVTSGRNAEAAGDEDGKSGSGADSVAPWIAQLATSDDVQPGVLLVAPLSLRAASLSAGQLVRVEGAQQAVSPHAISLMSDKPAVSSEDIRQALQKLLGERPSLVVNVGTAMPESAESNAKSLARIVSFVGTSGASKAQDQAQEAYSASESPEVPLLITRSLLESLDITCSMAPYTLDSDSSNIGDETIPNSTSGQLAGIDSFLKDAWQHLDSALMTRGRGIASGSGGILICGRRGSGKTSIARHLVHHAETQQRDRLVYCRYVECTKLAMDPRTAKTKEMLQSIAHDVLTNQPSLLVLDDIDGLLPAENEQADSKRVRQLVDALVSLLDVRDGRATTVVATAAGRAQVHGGLFTAGLFHDVLEIPAPGKAERELILAAIAQGSATPADVADVNFSILSYLTEGFMPADLHGLYERAVHEATMRVLEQAADASDSDDAVLVRHEDLVRAHSGYKPLSMRGVKLQASQTRWADIGGLDDTRRQLRETLELPTKYAAIFATSPLRLRSGVLLYGYPGCGKTLLASAIARECGLNFISTKGPELLSKYIGSSEQSVRDLFKRAVAAAPCVLFFDEFDSIAPRRGHDNTGVTDRVVNQFLTEMDGAEGLKGVYVLAATSRPDLIDPALLRPGRLDKAFLCGMPDEADRADVLRKQASKLEVSPGVDWNEIARRTESYTGADLQALVYNAFLESVHELTDKRKARVDGADNEEEDGAPKHAEFAVIGADASPAAPSVVAAAAKPLSAVERTQMAERLYRLLNQEQGQHASSLDRSGGGGDDLASLTPVVSMDHFEAAFKVTQPSLGEQDRRKFEAIYREFVDDKKGDGPRKPVEQRATLA